MPRAGTCDARSPPSRRVCYNEGAHGGHGSVDDLDVARRADLLEEARRALARSRRPISGQAQEPEARQRGSMLEGFRKMLKPRVSEAIRAQIQLDQLVEERLAIHVLVVARHAIHEASEPDVRHLRGAEIKEHKA